jgi:hypothetical protein
MAISCDFEVSPHFSALLAAARVRVAHFILSHDTHLSALAAQGIATVFQMGEWALSNDKALHALDGV